MEQHWKSLSEHLTLPEESRRRIRAQLAAQPSGQETACTKKNTFRLRAPLVAAALVAVMVVSVSAAALLGVFDRLKEQSAFALLGMNEVYEEYAYDVGLSAVTEGGNTFTLEKAAIDGNFCTIFFSYHYTQPLMTQAEFEALDNSSPWAAYRWTPELYLMLNGEVISAEGYSNSFELQQYVSDPSTVYGAWRCLLTAPLSSAADGAELELRGRTWKEEDGAWDPFSLVFPSRPCSSSVNTPDVTFSMYWGGKAMEIEVASLSRSPLGNLLTLRYEKNPNNGLGLDGSFVLRNKDTGAYIPFARVWTMKGADSAGILTDPYELFGDLSDLDTLELIPVWYSSAISQRTTVPLSSLPWSDPTLTNGGYAPASYRVADGNRLIVEMKPIGPVTTNYSSIGNGVCFLDKDGNELFDRCSVEKFKDRSTGTITVVTTIEDPKDFAANVDKVAALWFFTDDYTLLENKAVTIPCPVSLK